MSSQRTSTTSTISSSTISPSSSTTNIDLDLQTHLREAMADKLYYLRDVLDPVDFEEFVDHELALVQARNSSENSLEGGSVPIKVLGKKLIGKVVRMMVRC